jgi:hypothetical protein
LSRATVPDRANADDRVAESPAKRAGRGLSASPADTADAGDIARNQRVIPTSSTATEVNSISGKRSING